MSKARQAAIKKKRQKLEAEQKVLKARVTYLQNVSCKHPDVAKKPGSNAGNYDPAADYYWVDCNCPDCGKRWTEDQ